MPQTQSEMSSWLRELEIEFFIRDRDQALIIPYSSADSRRRIDVVIEIQDEGAFVQMSSMLGRLDSAQFHDLAVMDVINEINVRYRLIKVICDPARAVRLTADFAFADGKFTIEQFRQTLACVAGTSIEAQRRVFNVMDGKANDDPDSYEEMFSSGPNGHSDRANPEDN